MLRKKIQQALNKQLTVEYEAAFSYLSLAAFFESHSLKGFAHWMRVQSQEEMNHAARIFDYIHEREGKLFLETIKAPLNEWPSPLAAFKYALENEREISGKIDQLVKLAESEEDHATQNFLQWFVKEQVEEEAMVSEIVQNLERVGDNNNGLFLMDRDLAERNKVEPIS